VVLRVRGVTAVAEEITVRTTWADANDTDIAREVAEALDRAVDVPPASVKAVVHNGAITLSGNASWHHQREAATRAVRYLKGVTAQTNRVCGRNQDCDRGRPNPQRAAGKPRH